MKNLLVKSGINLINMPTRRFNAGKCSCAQILFHQPHLGVTYASWHTKFVIYCAQLLCHILYSVHQWVQQKTTGGKTASGMVMQLTPCYYDKQIFETLFQPLNHLLSQTVSRRWSLLKVLATNRTLLKVPLDTIWT